MKRRSLFGGHLYNQIVYPLLAASVVVGIVATVVAVYFLDGLTTKWVAQAAQNSTENINARLGESVLQMQREARLCVEDAEFVAAVESGDDRALRDRLLQQESALAFDGMAVFDADGRVLASVGDDEGSAERLAYFRGLCVTGQTPQTMVTSVPGGRAVTVVQPIAAVPGGRALAVTQRIDDELLNRLGVGDDRAYTLYSSEFADLSTTIGDGFSAEAAEQVRAAMRRPDPAIVSALEHASSDGAGHSTMSLDGRSYEVWAAPVFLPFGDRDRPGGYVAGVASRGVAEEASRTTRNLIAAWSIVAVLALVGLGGWIARRVTDPLTELAEGARSVADGDFSTKVEVRGSNEIAELAGSFNAMTDSLQERSETLTKKVLELATLYEMSRSLGATLDMDELLDSVLQSALRIFDLDLGYVVLRDRDTGVLSLKAIRGAEVNVADGAVRSSMSDWVVREGRPLIFNPDAGGGRGQADALTGARAALCVPLTSTEGTIGSVTIGSSRPDYRFSGDDVRLLSTIANHVTMAIGNIELFTSLQEAYLATVRSLAAAVDAKDTYTRGHSDRVAAYATMIAERMQLSHDQRIALEMAAYLHDIGKIGVPEQILLKPGRLDDVEMAQMRHHPLIGANILKPVAFPWAITPVVRHHHEAWDGNGYPAGLKGEEIPLLARILTVADSYEAMTADRPYRLGRGTSEAIAELRTCAGSQFDPAVVEVFASIVEELEAAGEEAIVTRAGEEIGPEEARAVFAALADGVFMSFRRLGGPRLSSNVEREVAGYFEEHDMPFRVRAGRISFTAAPGPDLTGEIAVMRTALRRIDATMGRVSGSTLVDHFYSDAFEGFSSRMRFIATELDFYEQPGG